MKRSFIIVCIAFFLSCSANTEKEKHKPESTSQSSSNNKVGKKDLYGIWADGKTENSTFEIRPDEIFYTDAQEGYPYDLVNDSLGIHFQEETIKYFVKKENDSLILSNPEFGETKFHRFTQ